MKEQFVSVGLLPVLNMPPADKTAVFPLKEQLVSVGLLPLLYIPPPWLAEFPLNVQLVTVGLLKEVDIPPPWTVLPPVITKPLRTVAGPSPLTQVTPLPEPRTPLRTRRPKGEEQLDEVQHVHAPRRC